MTKLFSRIFKGEPVSRKALEKKYPGGYAHIFSNTVAKEVRLSRVAPTELYILGMKK